jgi:hypothetical protein
LITSAHGGFAADHVPKVLMDVGLVLTTAALAFGNLNRFVVSAHSASETDTINSANSRRTIGFGARM